MCKMINVKKSKQHNQLILSSVKSVTGKHSRTHYRNTTNTSSHSDLCITFGINSSSG